MVVWLALSVAGAAVIALPDDGPRVVSISQTHGPAARDLVGIGVLLLGWAIFLVALWRVHAAISAPPLLAAAGVAGGGAVVVWSVLADAGMWWVAGAAILVGVQLWAGLSAAITLTHGAQGS